MSRFPARTALCGGAALCAAAALAARAGAAAGQTARDEVVGVEFVGNEAFSDAELRVAVFTEASSCPPILSVTTCALGIDWGRERHFFSRRILDEDLDRLRLLYRGRGYRRVAVEPELARGDGTVAVTFRIREGNPYRVGSIGFEGDSLPAELDLGGDLPIGPGDPANFRLIIEARRTLEDRLRNAGYAHAAVFFIFDRAPGSDTAAVGYEVDLGPATIFGPIRVTGNELLDSEVVLARLPFREGQTYRESQIREAQRSLHELGLVSRALVERDTARTETDSIVPIRITVGEGDVHRVRTGGGVNSADCVNVEGTWTSRNFFGGGRTARVRGRLSNLLAGAFQSTPLCSQAGTGDFGQINWLVGVDFNQPNLGSRRSDLAVGLFAERQSRRNVFVREALGIDLGISRSLGSGSFVNARYRPQLNRLAAAEVTLCATFLACTPDDIAVLSRASWLAPVATSYSRDRTDNIFSPAAGSKLLVDVEAAGAFTGSDYAYLRAFADASLYRGVGARGAVLASRIRVGRVVTRGFAGSGAGTHHFSEVVPAQKRFYGGGANSVRGFAHSTLGPRSLSIGVQELLRLRGDDEQPTCEPETVLARTCDGSPLARTDLYQLRPVGGLSTLEASVELRYPLAGFLGAAAFVDVGQVWPRGLAFDDMEVSPGVGFRYSTPFGPVRLDLAYSFRREEALQVVTSQVRRFVPGQDLESEKIDIAPEGGAREAIDWVVSDDLAILGPKVLFGDEPGFSFRRFQLHFSIGQAF